MPNEKKETVEHPEVCVIGLGFVGLTLGLVLSEIGLRVSGVDKSEKVIGGIKNKKPHFYEKGLVELLSAELGERFDCFLEIPKDKSFGIYIISVGTPVNSDNEPNFSQLKSASTEVGQLLKKGDLVILRSTVPIGATRDFVIPILEKESGMSIDAEDYFVSFAPERTVEGDAINELRVLPQVVGGYNKASLDRAVSLFDTFAPHLVTVDSLEEAEMVKVINNSYRDLTFAFANELALICDIFNIDTNKTIDAANVGYSRSNVPKPSPGVGGYCLTKDPYLLAYSAYKRGDYSPLLSTISRKINASMPNYVYKRIIDFLDKKCGNHVEKKVSLLGLAFKGNPPTSDVRFSPTLDVVRLLKTKCDIKLCGHDFLVERQVFDENGVYYEEQVENAFRDASCVVVMNNHPKYSELEIRELIGSMKKPALFFDPWKLFDTGLFEDMPDVYYCNLGFHNY